MGKTEKQAKMLPVYAVIGEDELKRQVVLKRLKARIEAYGDLSFNSDTFNGERASAAAIIAACNTMPFASELRLVQVDNVEKLKKSDADEIAAYCEAPASSTVLALVADKLSAKTKLYKAVASFGPTAIIDCSPKKRYELAKAVKELAVGHGVSLTSRAAETLIDLVGENTVRLDNELQKIALAHRGVDKVNEHEISLLVSRTAEVKPWEFVDAFSARNLSKCITYLHRMDSASPYALLAMCVSRIRELICARCLCERGNSADLARTLKMPDWRVKNHIAWSRGFTPKELRDALISAREAERAMKSGPDPNDVFQDWVLSITKRQSGSFDVL